MGTNCHVIPASWQAAIIMTCQVETSNPVRPGTNARHYMLIQICLFTFMQAARDTECAPTAPPSWDDCMLNSASRLGNDRRKYHGVGCCNPSCTNLAEASEAALPMMLCSGCSIAR